METRISPYDLPGIGCSYDVPVIADRAVQPLVETVESLHIYRASVGVFSKSWVHNDLRKRISPINSHNVVDPIRGHHADAGLDGYTEMPRDGRPGRVCHFLRVQVLCLLLIFPRALRLQAVCLWGFCPKTGFLRILCPQNVSGGNASVYKKAFLLQAVKQLIKKSIHGIRVREETGAVLLGCDSPGRTSQIEIDLPVTHVRDHADIGKGKRGLIGHELRNRPATRIMLRRKVLLLLVL